MYLYEPIKEKISFDDFNKFVEDCVKILVCFLFYRWYIKYMTLSFRKKNDPLLLMKKNI